MAGDVGSFSFTNFVASSKSLDYGVSQYLSAEVGSEALSSTTETQYLYRFGELLMHCCVKANDNYFVSLNPKFRAHTGSMFLVKIFLFFVLLFRN